MVMDHEAIEKDRVNQAELLVLLILGIANKPVSMLHLQKIFFTLWRFSPIVRALVRFAPHLKGPFSRELEDIVKSPEYFEDCWEYRPPESNRKNAQVLGGYVLLTNEGKKCFSEIIRKLHSAARRKKEIRALLSALEMVVPLYLKLDWDELLFLFYTDASIKDYSRRSYLSKEIISNASHIVEKLIRKRVFPEEAKNNLMKRAEEAEWVV